MKRKLYANALKNARVAFRTELVPVSGTQKSRKSIKTESSV